MGHPRTALVIHGGAGRYKSGMTPEKERAFHAALNEALLQGHQVLRLGGSALDAVERAVNSLEDCPLFNAGRGSVFTHNGKIEMDAAIMDGKNLCAGSVAFVTSIKNPITAARAVMERTEHVMLVGPGAEEFARDAGVTIVDPSYFFTEARWESWQKIKNQEHTELNLGTVGAVALDQHGNLAAATSTGGMNNKKFGRIGDSGIVGAGVYANNRTCAISSTGHGEYFMRLCSAYDISALMEYRGLSLEEAAQEAINRKMHDLGGTGGIIGVDRVGNVTMDFNTDTMFRGYVKTDGVTWTGVGDDVTHKEFRT